MEYQKVVSLLLLNITEVFDNINQSQLIHKLQKRQVDYKLGQ